MVVLLVLEAWLTSAAILHVWGVCVNPEPPEQQAGLILDTGTGGEHNLDNPTC